MQEAPLILAEPRLRSNENVSNFGLFSPVSPDVRIAPTSV
jgi:hypothetical protein